MNQDKVAIWLKFVNLECDRLSVEVLEPHDLTLTQYKILKFLLINPQGTIRQVDIEEHFYIRNPTVTRVLQNLEKKGLVTRQTNPQDNRSKVICLTEKAKSMESLLYQLGDELEAKLTANLTPRDKEELLRLLKKILNRKDEDDHE
ncbi:MAG: MarR family transcriptional regulator [Synergistaceae bacterium]|nr:MarR family transcriptional regulator [Synergistaceae bacterium]